MGEGQLDTVLAVQNMTVEEFRNDTIEMYTEDYTIFSLFNETVFKDLEKPEINLDVTDEEITAHYNENKEFYNMIDASHILVCYQGAASCAKNRTKEEAQAIADEVYEQLKNSKSFEELAIEFSDGPSGPNGGNLGSFGKGQMVKEFEDAAFALKHPNQFTEPIETEFGFHIIKLNAIKNELNDFKTEISMQLQLMRQQEAQVEERAIQEKALGDFIKQLRAESDIRIYTARPSLSKGMKATPGIQTFSVKENPVCMENGKPIIRMFSTTTCPHCKWIGETYDTMMRDLMNQGEIVAYHWKLDTGDNSVSSFVETFVPESETMIFKDFNPGMGVPTFVFGCKYYRIGNGYEQERDLEAEKREFKAIIEELKS